MMTHEDLAELARDWGTSLRNRNMSVHTIRTYKAGVAAFGTWCTEQGVEPELTRRNAEAFVASLLDGGASSGTAYVRSAALRRFSEWCLAEQEITEDELATLKSPKVDQKVIEHLTPAQMRALLAACEGRSFSQVRDMALVRFMHSTGARSDEVISMMVLDLQIGAKSAVITRGKGGRGRRSGFGDRTAEVVGRYLRARRRHQFADRPELWLAGGNGRRADRGERGALTYPGLKSALTRRAEAAGIEGFHPHRLRHTAAVSWLRSGGSVPGLMTQMGWLSVEMVNRYVKAASVELAIEESHRLAVDDF